MEKKILSEKLIISIFDSTMNNTGWFNLYQIYDGTRNSWPYDIKRKAFIESQAQQNWWVIKFNWVNVEPSNLWNLLFWMNTANNYIPSFVARDILLSFETNNAKIELYWKYAEEIAKWDENSDEVWYDEWEDIYSQYVNLTSFDEKVNLITKAIVNTNPEYNKRSKIEQEKR